MLYERFVGRGTCGRCGDYAAELTYDRLARKDLCPTCSNYLQARRSTLGIKPRGGSSTDQKGGPEAA